MAAGKSKSDKPAKDDPNEKVVCRNRRALHNYEILSQIDCGIILQGSEVKSIRAGKIILDDAYARVRDGEVWLINCDIATYPQATYLNHEPRRERKLLLHRREIAKFAESADHHGLTLIPLEVRFQRGFVKIRLALAKGKKLHDKRDKIRKHADARVIREALKTRRP